MMKRIDAILAHPLYVANQEKIEKLEENRIFCRHGMNHSLDVARILYIKVLERQLTISKDILYATALLHDIGRAVEYESGIVHHEAGIHIALQILEDCGYDEEEKNRILLAIQNHKEQDLEQSDILCKLLYEADKQSRDCYHCQAVDSCYWSEDKKNKTILY